MSSLSRVSCLALLFALAASFLGYISQLTLLNNDVFHAMALFRESIELGQIAQDDLYAFTPTISPTEMEKIQIKFQK